MAGRELHERARVQHDRASVGEDPAKLRGRHLGRRLIRLAEDGIRITEKTPVASLLKRPEFTAAHLRRLLPEGVAATVSDEEIGVVVNDAKYSGYVQNQRSLADRMRSTSARRIPATIDYGRISGLSAEIVEKLARTRPETLAEAGGMPGMTPAALNLLAVYIELAERRAAL